MKSDKYPKRRRAAVDKEDCGMAMAASLLGDRWTLLIIREAFYGVTCFEDMRLDLDIPPATLKKRLKLLEDNDLLVKVDYQAAGERTRKGYVLSTKGQDLATVFLALRQWGDDHLRRDDPKTSLIDKRNGRKLRVGLVDRQGQEVSLLDARLRLKGQGA